MFGNNFKTLGFITLLGLLSACGNGGKGSGGNGGSSDTPDLTIFDNQVASGWTIGAWEQISEELTVGETGTTENSSWSIIDSDDAQRGKVIDITFFHNTGFADFAFRTGTGNDEPQNIDLSAYVEGDLVFDYRILNWANNQVGFWMSMQCGWPCRSPYFAVANQTGFNPVAAPDFPIVSFEGEWMEARIPMHYLLRDNGNPSEPDLDLTKVDVISMSPPWESPEAQRNVRYQLDNVRIEAGRPSRNTAEPPFNFFMFENYAFAFANATDPFGPTVEFSGGIEEVTGDIYLIVDISEDAIVVAADAFIDEFSQSGTITLTLNDPGNLGAGTYSQVVTARACKDANCRQEYRGSPQEVKVNYLIEP